MMQFLAKTALIALAVAATGYGGMLVWMLITAWKE